MYINIHDLILNKKMIRVFIILIHSHKSASIFFLPAHKSFISAFISISLPGTIQTSGSLAGPKKTQGQLTTIM